MAYPGWRSAPTASCWPAQPPTAPCGCGKYRPSCIPMRRCAPTWDHRHDKEWNPLRHRRTAAESLRLNAQAPGGHRRSGRNVQPVLYQFLTISGALAIVDSVLIGGALGLRCRPVRALASADADGGDHRRRCAGRTPCPVASRPARGLPGQPTALATHQRWRKYAAASAPQHPATPSLDSSKGVDGTFIRTASHDQRRCSLSTVSFAGLRLLSARHRGPGGAPAVRRGRMSWTAARVSAIS